MTWSKDIKRYSPSLVKLWAKLGREGLKKGAELRMTFESAQAARNMRGQMYGCKRALGCMAERFAGIAPGEGAELAHATDVFKISLEPRPDGGADLVITDRRDDELAQAAERALASLAAMQGERYSSPEVEVDRLLDGIEEGRD